MKRRVAVMLTLLLLLTACGAGENTPLEGTAEQETAGAEKPADGEPETEEIGACAAERPMEGSAPEGLTVEMERAVYDPSVERYTYFIHNNTDQEIEFGEMYSFQKWENGQWRDLVWEDGIVFSLWLGILQPGSAAAETCWLGGFEEPVTEGKYRMVKELEEHTETAGGETYTLYAEFAVGESIYTVETPYGFGPLEELPENYGAAAASENDVVFTHDGIQNDGAIEAFLFKSGLGADCQLRTVQDYGEGAVLVTDIIYERPAYGESHFLWRSRQNGVITKKRFSYIVTDGADLYLSNAPDWEHTLKYDSDKVFLLPEQSAGFVPAVEEQTAHRILHNNTRYNIWSADGAWSARLRQYDPLAPAWGTPTEFSVSWQKQGKGYKGGTYDLQDWDRPETAITAMEWQAENILRLTCETPEGGVSVLDFDPETEALTTVLCGYPPADN